MIGSILLKLVPLCAAVLLTLGCAVQPVAPRVSADSSTPSVSPSSAASGPTPSSSRPSGSPGSSTPPAAEPTGSPAARESVSISVGSDTRDVQVLTPQGLDSESGLLPLLVLLHPNNSSPTAMIGLAQADLLAQREGLIVALPPALARSWRGRVLGDSGTSDARDAEYVSGVIRRLMIDYQVDPQRVAVAGFSMGAVVAGRIACEHADLVVAAVLVGGTDWGGECAPAQPVSVLVLHGTADQTFTISDAEAFADKWRELDGCPAPATDSSPGADTIARTSSGCDDGTAVEFVRVEGQGHSWFKNPNATELMWSFLTTYQPSR